MSLSFSLQRNPARRVITNNTRVYVFHWCQWHVLHRPSAALMLQTVCEKQASRSATAQCLKPTPLICLHTEPFQFIKLQNSYIVLPNNRQPSKRKWLYTSTPVMTLWIELSLECPPHQTAGPPRKKMHSWVAGRARCNVIRKCVMYMEKMWNESSNH